LLEKTKQYGKTDITCVPVDIDTQLAICMRPYNSVICGLYGCTIFLDIFSQMARFTKKVH